MIARRRPRTAWIAAGLTLAALALLLNPVAARALLPNSAWVFGDHQAGGPSGEVLLNSLPQVTRSYDVLMRNDDKPTKLDFTGVPIIELLKARGDIDVTKVPFVKIRFGDQSSDASILLTELTGVADGTPPPMILDSGRKPGVGKWSTPSIVPGQPGARPIPESLIKPFNRRDEIAVIPAKQGARIIGVRIRQKRKRNGEWLFTASVTRNSPGGSLKYEWFGFDRQGRGVPLASGRRRFATTDACHGRGTHVVNVVVTSIGSGSTGVGSRTYVARRSCD